MADEARSVPASAGASHAKCSSQIEFSNRLKHLQRSDPVNAVELTHRLNAILEGTGSGVPSTRRQAANSNDNKGGGYSPSKTPSEVSTPQRNARQTTFDSVDLARSTMLFDAQTGDNHMSRIVNALRACRDADPQLSHSNPAPRQDEDERPRRETTATAQNEFVGFPKVLARGSVIFAAPQVLAMEKPMVAVARSSSVKSPTNIANAIKKRTSRKAPPPMILTAIPKAAKPEIVDVTSPITTKLDAALPNLEPLSPFGPTFTENAGTFLVYQPEEIRNSAISMSSNGLSSAGLESQASPSFISSAAGVTTELSGTQKGISRIGPTMRRIPGNRSSDGAREGRKDQLETHISPAGSGTKPATLGNTQGRKHMPNIMLPETSETEETDGHSETAVSPIFDVSDAQSSRTSFGQSTTATRTDLKHMPLKRTMFWPQDFVDLGYEAALSQAFPKPPSSSRPSPVSSSTRPINGEPRIEDGQDASPLGSPSSVTILERILSLPPAEQQNPSGKRFSIARKPVTSGPFDGSIQENTDKQVSSPRVTRHDSTGFTAAREYIRDSVDGDHVRSVRSAAHRRSDCSSLYSEPASKPQQLPSLTTSGQQRGKWELIADGIALMESDSPTGGRPNQKLPTPTVAGFRASTYAREMGESLYVTVQNLAVVDAPQTQPLPSTLDQLQKDPATSVNTDESPAVALKRAVSRDRRGTDATITSLSSRPDFRARPLIPDAPDLPNMPVPYGRPRTAGGNKSTQPTPLPSLLSKMPVKIKFPPRANVAELGAMSPECLKLLHEQEALLQKRYDAVLNPIDNALKKKPNESAPNSAVTAPKNHHDTRSKSVDIASAVQTSPQADANVASIRRQEQIARGQADVRMQRRNLGTAVKGPGRTDDDRYHGLQLVEPEFIVYGEPMGLPGDFPSPNVHSKSAFTFDDDTPEKRKKGKWKFWKTG